MCAKEDTVMSSRERERQLGEADRLRKLAGKAKDSILAARINLLASVYERDPDHWHKTTFERSDIESASQPTAAVKKKRPSAGCVSTAAISKSDSAPT